MILIGPLEISASRWPWMEGYDWHGMTKEPAPLNPGGARFGGGWRFSLGLETAGWEKSGIHLSFDLLFGSVDIKWRTKEGRRLKDDNDKFWKEHGIKTAVDKREKEVRELLSLDHERRMLTLQDKYDDETNALRAMLDQMQQERDVHRADAVRLTEQLKPMLEVATDCIECIKGNDSVNNIEGEPLDPATSRRDWSRGDWTALLDGVIKFEPLRAPTYTALAEHGTVAAPPPPPPDVPRALRGNMDDEIPF